MRHIRTKVGKKRDEIVVVSSRTRDLRRNQTLENRLRENFGIAKGVGAIRAGRYDSGGCLADTRTHRYVYPAYPALVAEKRYTDAARRWRRRW